MKKIMKRIGWFAIPIIIIIAALILWSLKPVFLSSYLTSRLGVRVMVGSINIGTTQTNIGDFKIKNPHGYKTQNAFRANRTEIDYQTKRLFGNPSEIDTIAISDIFLSVEFNDRLGKRNNWTQILDKLPKHTHQEKELIIHKLTLDNLKIEVRGLALGGTITKQVDHLEIDEISSKGGFPTAELIKQIFGGAGLQQYLQDLLNPTNTIKKLFSPGLFGSEEREGIANPEP